MGQKSSKIHVFGGTSDALLLCQRLESLSLSYSLSVATYEGAEMARGLTGAVLAQQLNKAEMGAYFKAHNITLVIDATHPFATEVSNNIISACAHTDCWLIRYERPTQIDRIDDPLLIKVESVEAACQAAQSLGNKIFLTTGSKELPKYVALLPDKQLIARVLPTAGVIAACNDLGLGINEIVAMKGPFTEAMNEAMVTFYAPDGVITKESGDEGGYQEKVAPCLRLGVPCIVIRRPSINHKIVVSNLDELTIALEKS